MKKYEESFILYLLGFAVLGGLGLLGWELYCLHCLLEMQTLKIQQLEACLETAQAEVSKAAQLQLQTPLKVSDSGKPTSGDLGFILVMVIWAAVMVPVIIAGR